MQLFQALTPGTVREPAGEDSGATWTELASFVGVRRKWLWDNGVQDCLRNSFWHKQIRLNQT
jgi:hypothetical protein